MSEATVDMHAIERELHQMWQEQANHPNAGGQAVIRALTLNLIVRVYDDEWAEKALAVAPVLTAQHPNRMVIVIDRPGNKTELQASVQALCTLTNAGRTQVCGEQVTISARGAPAGQLASLVLPLLLPDLPVVLWAPGPQPFTQPLVQRLYRLCDRVIVDSTTFADPVRELGALAAFEQTTNGSPAISDLGWTRLTPWRELTAQFFDTRPFLPHLHRIDEIVIEYAANTTINPVGALLFVGWLASCLKWIPLEDAVGIEGEIIRLYLRRPAVGVGPSAIRLVNVEIRPVQHSGEGFVRLSMRAVDNQQASFDVELIDDEGHACTRATIAGTAPIERTVSIERPTLADLLSSELRLLSRDRTFAAALQLAGGLARRFTLH
ncbi:MAG: glucose-6-phosphate dehydrogenase [Chloroflexus sp.]|uniref:glucose-6-phosphate dehydrogenase assembly protein OpcA n=1 Tax=Chloroflexus sp. TaxID=1904827 RepID=UPI0021DE5F52|nr:glucose-6-phosphate dehydrogenase assembly protein OpcA [Chloroflexus sp.]GIV87599.1 MAG: glucose-6-phosphate dehydrogenase [Chloroflexus sp.]